MNKIIKSILSTCIALITIQTLNGQTLEWINYINSPASIVQSAAERTFDGGVVIVGNTSSNNKDLYVAKTDKWGNLEWGKNFGGDKYDAGRSIKQTSDSGYIAVGNTSSYTSTYNNPGASDIWVLRLDKQGNKLWEKAIGKSNWDYANQVIQCNDGGFVVLAELFESAYTGNSIYIFKLSSEGELVWEKSLDSALDDWGFDIDEANDSSLLIIGNRTPRQKQVDSCKAGQQVMIIKLDKDGEFIWEITPELGGSWWEIKCKIIADKDDSFIIAGNNEPHYNESGFCFFSRISTDGDMIWLHKYYTPDYWPKFSSLFSDNQNGFILVACLEPYACPPGTKRKYLIIDTDSTGNQQWEIRIPTTLELSENDEVYSSILLNPKDEKIFFQVMSPSFGSYLFCGTNIFPATTSIKKELTGLAMVKTQLEPPVYSLQSCSSEIPISVQLTANSEDMIYYTTDGSDPECYESEGGNDTVFYTTPSAIGEYQIRAISCRKGWITSEESAQRYIITKTLSAPIFEPAGDTSNLAITFTIIAKQGESIYYTLNNEDLNCFSGNNSDSIVTITTPLEPGRYVYKAIACRPYCNQSAVSEATFIVKSTGILQDSSSSTHITLSPNPTDDMLTITLTNFEDAVISIHAVSGIIIKRKKLFSENEQIDLSSLKPGVYFAEVSGFINKRSASFTKKIIIY
jgi:hypothetical protein